MRTISLLAALRWVFRRGGFDWPPVLARDGGRHGLASCAAAPFPQWQV